MKKADQNFSSENSSISGSQFAQAGRDINQIIINISDFVYNFDKGAALLER